MAPCSHGSSRLSYPRPLLASERASRMISSTAPSPPIESRIRLPCRCCFRTHCLISLESRRTSGRRRLSDGWLTMADEPRTTPPETCSELPLLPGASEAFPHLSAFEFGANGQRVDGNGRKVDRAHKPPADARRVSLVAQRRSGLLQNLPRRLKGLHDAPLRLVSVWIGPSVAYSETGASPRNAAARERKSARRIGSCSM
jgi:hypothetical protein